MNPNPKKSIGNAIVIGLQGQGKSTLINIILGKNVAKVANDDEVIGETSTVTKYEGNIIGTDTQITLIDVPGYGGLKFNDNELTSLFKNHFSNMEVKAILYVSSLANNRITTSDIYLLEITKLAFGLPDDDNKNLPPFIFVGTNADRLDNLPSKIKETTHCMIKELNKHCLLNLSDSIIVSNKINNSSEILKLNNILLNSSKSGRIQSSIVIDVLKNLFLERLKKLGFECFSSTTRINKLIDNNEIKSTLIREVEIGDLIECNEGKFERILTKTKHIDKSFIYKLLKFVTEDGNFLELTENHYVYIIRNQQSFHIPSKMVKLNDCFLMKEGDGYSLKEIKLIQINYTDCVINIRTSSRTIIANNFLSSCVIEGDFGEVGHSILLFANKIDCKLPQKVKNLGLFLKSLIK